MTSESLLVLDLERLGVRAQVDLLRDGSLARGVAHLERDLLGLLRALLAVVLATLGLPDVSLNPARDLLLALAGEDGLVECVASGRVLLLWKCQLPILWYVAGWFGLRFPPSFVKERAHA